MKRTKFKYKIYEMNFPSGKNYIGLTGRSMQQRFKEHVKSSKSKKNQTLIAKAIRKYGKESIQIKCMDKVNDRKKAIKLEEQYIKKRNSTPPNGYNMSDAGVGMVPGRSRSKETKQKISKINKKYYAKPKNRQKLSDKMSDVYNSKEGRKKQRKRALLQNKPHTKRKIKRILKQKRSTEKYRKEKSIEQKRVWADEELRKKHSEIIKQQYENGREPWNKGKKLGPRSEETKRKISESLKKQNENSTTA